MTNENLLFSGVLHDSGFRYVIDSTDDMMYIAYREDGESDEYNHEKDILIAWEAAEIFGAAIAKIANMNKRAEA